MRYCDNCGASVPDGTTICGKCGSYVSANGQNGKNAYRNEIENAFRVAKISLLIRNILWAYLIGGFIAAFFASNRSLFVVFYSLTFTLVIVYIASSVKFSNINRSRTLLKKTNNTDIIDKITPDVYTFSKGMINANKDVIYQRSTSVVIPVNEIKEIVLPETPGKLFVVIACLFSAGLVIFCFLTSKRRSMKSNVVRFIMKKGHFIDITADQYEFGEWVKTHTEIIGSGIVTTEL